MARPGCSSCSEATQLPRSTQLSPGPWLGVGCRGPPTWAYLRVASRGACAGQAGHQGAGFSPTSAPALPPLHALLTAPASVHPQRERVGLQRRLSGPEELQLLPACGRVSLSTSPHPSLGPSTLGTTSRGSPLSLEEGGRVCSNPVAPAQTFQGWPQELPGETAGDGVLEQVSGAIRAGGRSVVQGPTSLWSPPSPRPSWSPPCSLRVRPLTLCPFRGGPRGPGCRRRPAPPPGHRGVSGERKRRRYRTDRGAWSLGGALRPAFPCHPVLRATLFSTITTNPTRLLRFK